MTVASHNALVGLRLDAAQARLKAVGRTFSVKEVHARPSRDSAPVWGDWRVIRVRNGRAADGVETVELLVAREMLRDERVPRNKGSLRNERPARS